MKKSLFAIFLIFFLSCALIGCNNEELEGIRLDIGNVKTVYELNETFSSEGLKVYATYKNGEKAEDKELQKDSYTIDASAFNSTVTGSYNIVVIYKVKDVEYKETFIVSITNVLVDIELDYSAVKREFTIGEDFVSEGLIVKAKYADKSQKTISNFNIDNSEYNKNQVGNYDIKVSYEEEDITKVKTYQVSVIALPDPQPVALHINTSDASTIFVLGDSFSHEGIVVSLIMDDESIAAYLEDDYVIDSSAFDANTIGKYEIKVKLTLDGKELEGKYEVSVETNIINIDSVDKFLEMRLYKNAENINSRIYTLSCDIDLSGHTLEPTTVIFTGTFDGKGHTIKNAVFKPNASKQGMMFFKVKDATFKNIRFFGCSVNGGASETISLIAGECNEVGATFENIEFSCCTVDNKKQNYAALMVGRNESNPVELTFKNITVKNLTSISSKQYAGCLVSDVIKGSKVVAENCDIDVTINCSNNISVISGRNRGALVDVKNTIVRFEVGGTSATASQIGIFADGNAASTIKAQNVLILKCTALTTVDLKNVDLVHGRANNISNTTIENVYLIDGKSNINTVNTNLLTVSESDVTYDWLTNTLLLPTGLWETDSNKIIKLKSASPNTPGVGETISKLILIDSAVKKQYFAGDEFTLDGLLVTAIYTDGCIIPTTDFQYAILDGNNEEVDVTNFAQLAVGPYKVKISCAEVFAEIEIFVVEETDIEVNHEFVKKVYAVGDKLDLTDIVVFAKISDGTKALLGKNDYVVKVTDENNQEIVNFVTANKTYTVAISRANFIKTFDIIVLDKLSDCDAIVNVYVDGSIDNVSNEDNKLTFKTIQFALDYLESLGLDDQVSKNIYLADGSYNEKIIISMPNVTLIGTSKDKEKVAIEYDIASGYSTPDGKTTYGTDNAAVVIITAYAKNFIAKNIYFKNIFNYNQSNLANKQGLAVRCDADKAIFYQCGFYGNQDTLEAKTGRQYYYECLIEGNVDFIFGNNATAVFDKCEIKALCRYNGTTPETNNGYVCATKGFSSSKDTDTVKYNYVFLNCNFTSDPNVLDGSMSIARPWGVNSSIVCISCDFSKAYSTLGYDGSQKSRYFDMSGIKPTEAKFYEYDSKGEGSITEAVNGMSFLSEQEVLDYTLNKIFAAQNGQVLYSDDDWAISLENNQRYVFYYELGKEEYIIGEEPIESTIKAYLLTSDDIVFTKIDPVVALEKIYDVNGQEVTLEDAINQVGEYTAKLLINDVVVDTLTFVVIDDTTEIVTITLDASDPEVASEFERGTSFKDGIFTFYGKKGDDYSTTRLMVSPFDVKVGSLQFTKGIKISGGKANVSENEDEIANCVKVVASIAGKVTIICSQKTETADPKPNVNLILFSSTGEKLVTSDVCLALYGEEEMSVVTFEVEAGTYYIGANSGGFYLYNISYEYKQVPKKEETILCANDITDGTLFRGATFNGGIFTIYGKAQNDEGTANTTISVSPFKLKAGSLQFTKGIKISGGKANVSENEDEIANCVKVVANIAGKVTIICSQKTETADPKPTVNLILFSSTGDKLVTSDVNLALYGEEEMSVVTFEVEAGTYYIGASSSGFYLYNISYIR